MMMKFSTIFSVILVAYLCINETLGIWIDSKCLSGKKAIGTRSYVNTGMVRRHRRCDYSYILNHSMDRSSWANKATKQASVLFGLLFAAFSPFFSYHNNAYEGKHFYISPAVASTISDQASTDVRFNEFSEVWKITNENFFDSSHNNIDWAKVKNEYTQRLESGANEHELTKKLVQLLGDKYSRLLDKSVFEALWKYDAIGVGLLFQSEPNKPMFVSAPPITGSSAAKAGIQQNDVIYSINGISTEGMTAAQLLDMMSNDNSDTVTLLYGPEKSTVTLPRSKQQATNPVSYYSQKLSDGKIAGYVRLSEFNAEAVPGLKAALTQLNSEGVEEVLLDLRGNTGGGFQFALNIGGMFMQDRPMVLAVGKDDERNLFRSSFPDGPLFKGPLMLLTDGLSASASEVLAAGLHDNCRASIVGQRTFGKGKIQAVFGLSNGEGLTLTIAQYVTPLSGQVIQSRGISPDLSIDSLLNPYLRALLPSMADKLDLDAMPFRQAEEKLRGTCSVPEDTQR